MTETHVKWLLSHSDSEWHGFAVDQVADSAQESRISLCEDEFSVDLLVDTPPRSFCRKCLVRLGEQIPDENRWQTGL